MDGAIDQRSLGRLVDQSRGLDEITLQFSLDKEQLAKALYTVPAGCRAILYLYPEAFDALLRTDLATIEERLWHDDPNAKAVVLLPTRSILLDGPTLAVIGGGQIMAYAELSPPDQEQGIRLKAIHATAIEHLHWRRRWVRFLTPQHLDLRGSDDDGTVSDALRRHAARLFVLYTADKSVESDDGIVCTYTSPAISVDLIVPDFPPSESVRGESAAGVQKVLEWVYEEPTSTKRLSVAQLVFARHLHFVDKGLRFQRLLGICASVRDELIWTEKSIMSEALQTYAADVRSLEDYLDKTVQAFAEQAQGVVKSLTDTMLAGMGTVVVGILAMLLKEGTGSLVFGIALFVYAVYVFVFQIRYSLPNYKDRENVLADDFKYRSERFKELIYGQNVDRIIGTRVSNAINLFRKWSWRVLVASWAVVALSGAVGIWIIAANLISGWPSVPIMQSTTTGGSSPSPTAVATPTPSSPVALPTASNVPPAP